VHLLKKGAALCWKWSHFTWLPDLCQMRLGVTSVTYCNRKWCIFLFYLRGLEL